MVVRTVRKLPIPLGNYHWAWLEGLFPMTEAEWEMLRSVLDAMKPGLVPAPAPEEPGIAASAEPGR